MRSSDEEIVLGLLRKGAPDSKLNFAAQICFDETSYIGGFEVIPALQNFATIARIATKLFE
jgi:hypothetical protein